MTLWADEHDLFMDIFRTLLVAARAKLSPGQQKRLQWNSQSVFSFPGLQGKYLFCLVASSMVYPDRLAFELLQELEARVAEEDDLDTVEENGANDRLMDSMTELV